MELIEFSKEEKAIIRRQFFPPDATDIDMQYCMSVAKNIGLSPILKEIFFVTRKQNIDNKWVSKVEPVISRHGALTIAHKSGVFDGIESGTKIAKVPKLVDGTWREVDELVGWARVYRKDISHPVYIEVAYSEYVQLKKDGTLNKFWEKMPLTMIIKVAEVQALKKAFNIRGVETVYDVAHSDDAEAFSVEKSSVHSNETAKKISKIVEGDILPDDNAEENVRVESAGNDEDKKDDDIPIIKV